MKNIHWKCPNCGDAMTPCLDAKPYVLRCDRGHSFDVAKQGYVNLLLPRKRGATLPGDSPEMVRARTAFLGGGYYEAFSDGVNTRVADALAAMQPAAPHPVLADAGCGEGYYTKRLCTALCGQGLDASCVGFDLSRDAVSHASRCASADGLADRLSFAVASLFEMPVSDGSIDGIVDLFAPTAEAEFARVLKPNGFLLLAVPAARHLWGLKAAVYDVPYENEVRRDTFSHFVLTDVREIRETIAIRTNEHIRALFSMTPYYWKTSKRDADKLNPLETLETEIAFDLLLYRKKGETVP